MTLSHLVGSVVLGVSAATLLPATPLNLEYTTTDLGGGRFGYEFELELDNNDGSFNSGQGWGWFVFGDAFSSSSPLTNFVLTSPVPGPWDSLDYSSGGHNGPTFAPVSEKWFPELGDTLTWSGTSTALLLDGEMLFSTLWSVGGAVDADFEVAHHVDAFTSGSSGSAVPDAAPSSLLAGLGLGALAIARRRFPRG